MTEQDVIRRRLKFCNTMMTFRVDVGLSCFVSDVEDLLGIKRGDSYLMSNGRLVSRSDHLVQGQLYYVFPRVLGGKGGFGSMLRAIGAQIEKTTSREACRDLSGRRIRDVNNEKKLKEWVAKQGDRVREGEEREERRRAKRAKYLQDSPARMNNPEYDAQYSKIMKSSEEALQQGLARLKKGQPGSRKRKADCSSTCALDKYDRWNMMGGLNPEDVGSDSGAESGDSSSHAHPGLSSAPPENVASPSSSSYGLICVSEDRASSSSCSSSSSSSHGPSPPKTSTPPSSTVTSTSAHTPCGDGGQDVSPCKVARLDPTAASEEAWHSGADRPEDMGGESSETSKQADRVEKEGEKSSGNSSNNTAAVPDSVSPMEPINLEQYADPEELEALGMERLKEDLLRRGLKCGGNLQERAQRLFSIRGLAPHDIPVKLLAKGKGQGKGSRQ